MDEWLKISLLAWGAGLAMPVGAMLGCLDQLWPNWLNNELRHSVIAFGGGALMSAIALVLVPEGMEGLSIPVASLCFATGGLLFLGLDVLLAAHKSPAGQMVAMLSDFVPEAVALGAAFATGGKTGILLAALIALQNLPEGFNSYRELTADPKVNKMRVILAFALMSLLGPLAAMCGYFWLATLPHVVSGMMLFAAGGILYLVFQDIAPQAKLEKRWAPPFGAVLGFLLGMIGKMITG